MLDRVQERLKALKVEKSARIVVAYSGGPDSTALLQILVDLGYDVVAAHLNHGMRSEAADEAEFLRGICAKLDVPFYVANANVSLAAKELGIGIEDAGRRARYEFLQRLSLHLGDVIVATGHTQDDHVETVLLNLTRGTGLDGLRGIPAERDNIVRPLLDVTRAETRRYCVERGLSTLSDPGNENEAFSRVRIRKRVVPELMAINPAVLSTVSRLADTIREEVEFLNGIAARALEESELSTNGKLSFLTRDCEVVLDATQLNRWPIQVIRRSVSLVARSLGSALDHSQLQALGEAVQTGGQISVTSEGGDVDAVVKGGRVQLAQKAEVRPFREHLDASGAVDSAELGWTLKVGPGTWHRHERDALDVSIDRSSLRAPLHFRNLEPGDRIMPLGFSGHRKVADLMSEAGLTLAARRRLPIICDMIEPIWVPGVCLSQRVAASATSETVIRMTFGPLERS